MIICLAGPLRVFTLQGDCDWEAASAAVKVQAELLHPSEHPEAPGGQRAKHGVCHRQVLPAVSVRAVSASGQPNLLHPITHLALWVLCSIARACLSLNRSIHYLCSGQAELTAAFHVPRAESSSSVGGTALPCQPTCLHTSSPCLG